MKNKVEITLFFFKQFFRTCFDEMVCIFLSLQFSNPKLDLQITT